jgi:MFS family permease
VKKFLTRKNSLVLLRMNNALVNGMAGLFLPILLSQQLLDNGVSSHAALIFTIIAFGGTYFFNASFAYFVGRFIHRYGIRAGLSVGTVLWSIFYFVLPFADNTAKLLTLFLLNGIGIIFWWHSFNTLFGVKSSQKSYGKDFAWHQIAAGTVSIFAPAIGGAILISSNRDILYFVTGFVCLLGLFIIPTTSKHVKKPDLVTFRSVTKLFKSNWRYPVAYFGEGIADSANAVVWPLALFILADERYDLTVGLLLLVILVTAILTRIIGVTSDSKPRKSLFITVSLTSIGLASKIPNILPLSVVGDSLSQIGKSAGLTVSFSSSLRQGERKGNQNSYLIAREWGLNYGRAAGMFIYAGMIFAGLPLTSIFIVASIASLFLLLLESK